MWCTYMVSNLACILFAGKTVTVIYPYIQELDDELAMKTGDVITVDDWDISDDWALGTLNGKTGLFYKDFTKLSSEVPSPDDFKLKEVRGKPKGYTTTYQGREYILKEKLDEVECIICHQLADQVYQTSCCGSTICLGCADRWKKQSNSCPQCRKAPLEIIADPKTQRRITGGAVYCPNHHFGCDWVGSFGRVPLHLVTDCDFEKKECPNAKCKVTLPRTFIGKHQSTLCLWRSEVCPSCAKNNTNCENDLLSFPFLRTYHDIITEHCHKCPSWPMRCPNSCGRYLTLTQSTLDRHVREICPEAITCCPYTEVGCKGKGKRKDMAQHMQQAALDHMTAILRDHMKLKNDHQKLKNDHMKMKHENAQLKKELSQLKAQKK